MGKRTKDECHKEALKYKTRIEFKSKDVNIYQYAYRRKWMDEICSHMKVLVVKNRTFDECHKEALKYNTRIEFCEKSKNIYQYALVRKWMDEVCSHMVSGIFSMTIEECHKEALKYNTRNEFFEKSRNIQQYAYRRGWLDEICSHMEYMRNNPNTIYFWKVLGEDVWKVGICVDYRLNDRLNEVSQSHNFQIQEYYYKKVDNCREMEKLFLSKGDKVNSLLECDGYTEFRTFDDYELNRILDYFND